MFARYYHILGIPEGATKDEVKRAFYKKAKQYHPDINKGEHAPEQFIKIYNAFEVLYNGKPLKRRNAMKRPAAKPRAYQGYSRMRAEMRRNAQRKKYGTGSRNRHEAPGKGPATRFKETYFKEEYDLLGRRICYGMFYALLLFGGFMLFLPLFVLIFFPGRFAQSSTVVSLIMGVLMLRFANDWYVDLKHDFKQAP